MINDTTPTEMRVTVLLSLQRALLGMVTMSLRGVAVSWTEHLVCARFMYEFEDSQHVELMGEIETEVLADFHSDVDTRFTIEAAPRSTRLGLEQDEVWVYLRRET